jgi:elongation factor P
MPKACELKRNDLVEIQGMPYLVETLSVSTPSARGAASIYRFRFRNIVTKTKQDVACKGDESFGAISVERREVQYLFEQQGRYTFMALDDFSQFELDADVIEQQLLYLVADMEGITALVSDSKVLTIEMPVSVELTIVETDPIVRGASATSRTKPAKLQTGLVVQVPEYITTGERIKVDTRTGEFTKRA